MSTDKKSIELRRDIAKTLALGPKSRNDLAALMGTAQTAMGYHLTQMRKAGLIVTKKNKWHLATKSTKSKTPAPAPVEKPSLKVLLHAARAAVDEALAIVDDIEARMGGTN